MKKATDMAPANWQGYPILDPAHSHELEQRAAVLEFKDRLPRMEAQKRAHQEYAREQSLAAAAHHLQGMRAAGASGHQEEAKKHGAMYELHMKALDMDPYAEVPAEIKSRADAPDREKLYRFKTHKGDLFVFDQQKPSEANMNKKEELAQKLRKFWDDKYAAAKQHETLVKIATLAKMGLEVLKKGEQK